VVVLGGGGGREKGGEGEGGREAGTETEGFPEGWSIFEGQPAQPSGPGWELQEEVGGWGKRGGGGFTARRRVLGAVRPEERPGPWTPASSADLRPSGRAPGNRIPTHLKHRREERQNI